VHRRRRRLAIGTVLATVVAATVWLSVAGSPPASTASASDAPPPVVAAAVDAAGVPAGPPVGWTVAHVDTGIYEVTFPAPTTIALRSWTAAATVTTKPLSPATWVVRFVDDAAGIPVDSAFSFFASPTP